jgi:plasmid stabilization system protein ParE
MKNHQIGVAAERDMNAIWERLAQESIDEADRVIAGFFGAFDILARTPSMRPARRDLTDQPVHFWPFGDFMIVYRAQTENHIEIVAITEGPQDIPMFIPHESL